MATITGTNGNDFLTDEPGNSGDPGFAKIAPVTKPGAPGSPPPGTISYDDTIDALDGNDFVTINAGNDTVFGRNGNDTVYDKGNGNDTFYGEAGNDFLYAGLGNDFFNGGSGIDTVSYANSALAVSVDLRSGVATAEGTDRFSLVENVDGGNGGDTLYGSDATNLSDGANLLRGLGGNDWIDGRSGNDILCGDDGNDSLFGGVGSDTLYGGAGNDVLIGGTGNNVLVGGTGDDVMTGAWGESDRFVFQARDNFLDHDTITDFLKNRAGANPDKIDLSGIDARPDLAGNQAFTFDATADGGGAGEVEFRQARGQTEIYLSYGDGPADMSIVLEGVYGVSAADFIL